jgi:hypothetical protein
MGESKSVASQRFENFTSTNIFSYHNLEMVESSIISVNPSKYVACVSLVELSGKCCDMFDGMHLRERKFSIH